MKEVFLFWGIAQPLIFVWCSVFEPGRAAWAVFAWDEFVVVDPFWKPWLCCDFVSAAGLNLSHSQKLSGWWWDCHTVP